MWHQGHENSLLNEFIGCSFLSLQFGWRHPRYTFKDDASKPIRYSEAASLSAMFTTFGGWRSVGISRSLSYI